MLMLTVQVFLHEATVRLMAGASPARTLQLYGRNVRKRTTEASTERERRLVMTPGLTCFLFFVIIEQRSIVLKQYKFEQQYSFIAINSTSLDLQP